MLLLHHGRLAGATEHLTRPDLITSDLIQQTTQSGDATTLGVVSGRSLWGTD